MIIFSVQPNFHALLFSEEWLREISCLKYWLNTDFLNHLFFLCAVFGSPMRTELRHPLLPHVNKEDVLRYFINFPAYFEAVKSRFYSSSTNSGLK